MKVGNSSIELVEGDITELAVDTIVNPANDKLIMGGGVAGAILREGGGKIQKECTEIGKIVVGEAVITTGGKLKARWVIHAVGPRMREREENEKLKSVTLNSLKLADKYKLKTIAFPAISTGIFGFPMKRCAEIMLPTTRKYLKGKTQIKKIIFCLWGKKAFDTFNKALSYQEPPK